MPLKSLLQLFRLILYENISNAKLNLVKFTSRSGSRNIQKVTDICTALKSWFCLDYWIKCDRHKLKYVLCKCKTLTVSFVSCPRSGGLNSQFMNQAAGVPYPPQAGVAMDMSAYHNSSMPPVSYPVSAPPHQAPPPQQQPAVYYQQPLL